MSKKTTINGFFFWGTNRRTAKINLLVNLLYVNDLSGWCLICTLNYVSNSFVLQIILCPKCKIYICPRCLTAFKIKS